MSDSPTFFDRLSRALTQNEVTTREPGHYPEIGPRTYQAPADEVFDALREVVEARDNWTIGESDADARRLAFEAETSLMGFVYDVTVEVEDQEGETVVHVRSESRVGEGDLGKNASRVRELFDQLDRAVG